MKLYHLHAKQALPISSSEAWQFLSNPHNLKHLTPKEMDFTILSGADRPLYAGQIIQYRVKPLPGFSTKWVSEITQVEEGDYFVDEQLYGPYALWHHKHFITVIDGGVVMEDLIHYKIPFGFLGQLLHPVLVKKELLKIFEYREVQLENRFGKMPNYQNSLILN
ncbi:MAG: SRPBCC family protein [Bacteroidota bacterium]